VTIESSLTTSDRLYRTIEAALGVGPGLLSEQSSPQSIAEWDSLNHITLVMALESEFGIEMSAEDALEMRTVGRIRSILREYGVDL
jgi:acyl carrier protein